MEENFDMESAVSDIGSSLGFGDSDGEGGSDGDDFLDGGDGTTSSSDSSDGSSTGSAVDAKAPAAQGESKPAAPETPASTVSQAPKTWRPEAAAAWSQLPPKVQQEIAKREQDIFTGLEASKVDATFGKTFKSIIDPYYGVLQSQGIDPVRLTSELLASHTTLSVGTPEQKQAVLQRLVQAYGLQLPTAAPTEDDSYYTDPQVRGLLKEVSELKSQLGHVTNYQAQTERARSDQIRSSLATEIDTFAADPANSYFDEVAQDIVGQLKGGAKDLKEAYERAIFANPVTRTKEIARITADNVSKANAEAAARAKQARAATSANVQSSAKSGSTAAPRRGLQNMDATMNETLKEILSRS